MSFSDPDFIFKRDFQCEIIHGRFAGKPLTAPGLPVAFAPIWPPGLQHEQPAPCFDVRLGSCDDLSLTAYAIILP
jgi:hypothetical protein